MSERFNIHSQLEHLQMKYIGTGHPDITRYEWVVNHHRDSAASYIGHPHMLLMFGIAENESIGRVRYRLLQQMVAPCGKAPKEDDEEEEDDE
ncbi:hypothetical protein AAMO2058_001678700 [Amorphochlora amoebiformis]|mmetsp:Transcript_5780/g.8889  ORF Transcript_5780/g.8889 Transcript_5780/m.8889 type:complete len:92 (-) Transcript_5780:112-387(-)